MTSLFAVPVCHLCGVKTLTTADKVEPGPFTCHACIAVAAERANIRQFCLDQASLAGQRAKQAGKRGDKTTLGAALVEAEAFRKVARLLTPKKPKAKKTRKVTT